MRDSVLKGEKKDDRQEDDMHVCIFVLNVLPSSHCAPLFFR